MAYVKKTIISGRVVEIVKKYDRRYFPKGKHAKFKNDVCRQPKQNVTTEQQEKVNYRQKELKLTRLLNCNFTGGDFHIVFSYREDLRPNSIEELKDDKKKLLRKLRTEYKKQGKELKYICVAEIGKRKALHFHFVVNQIDTSIFQKCWTKGFIKISLLDNTGQYKDLASYLIKYTKTNKEEAKQLNGAAWNSSKNLEKPIVKEEVITKSEFFKEEVTQSKRYKNYYLEKDSVHSGFDEFTGYKFFKYTLVRLN
ncbi:hypothetical protein [Intestinibacter bartlettii]|jgi:hypothetical protein|uniref:rolling circle replication-associated protein n=1 Tax=Intestinibacter bartlettii TaxID=261299 RepID=UPI0025DC345E|nr:hypothetical protein [uncultured Intestinibacter sp.]